MSLAPLYNIVCFSNQLWDWPLWTNKHQVMSRLAKMGHTVIFVDPPINPGLVFFKQLLRGKFSLARILTQTKIDSATGVIVYTPINFFGPLALSHKIHTKIISYLMRKHFQRDSKTLLWIYHVELLHLPFYIDTLQHDILIYDCVDYYLGFPDNQSLIRTTVRKSQLQEQEATLAQRADILFVSAPQLLDHLKRYNPNVHFTPNAGDYDLFKDAKKVKELPRELTEIRRPRIGFTGALDDYKFDMESFLHIVRANPSYSFVLLGNIGLKDSDANLAALRECENVYFLGYRPYKELPKYFAGFDAYIIPYVLNDYTMGGCFPTKFHDALASGLPVIVSDLPVYKMFSDVCYIAKNANDFSDKIRLAIQEDSPHKVEARRSIAKNNSWDGKTAKMLELLKTLD